VEWISEIPKAKSISEELKLEGSID